MAVKYKGVNADRIDTIREGDTAPPGRVAASWTRWRLGRRSGIDVAQSPQRVLRLVADA
jgi:hypothetical protein